VRERAGATTLRGLAVRRSEFLFVFSGGGLFGMTQGTSAEASLVLRITNRPAVLGGERRRQGVYVGLATVVLIMLIGLVVMAVYRPI
jgi:hypothetical protein